MNANRKDEWLGQVLKAAGNETAPEGFSHAVMERIQALGAARVTVPPLIPRWGWALIALAATGLAGWGWIAGRNGGEGLLPESLWSGWLKTVRMPPWELPSLPPSLVYSAAALTVFLLLQVLWMRRRLQRQWAM